MVSAKFSQLPGKKPLQNNALLPLKPPDVKALDNVDLEFSDVFGPVPAQSPIYENVAVPDTIGLAYEDPTVVYSRSHSFVGPTTCINQTQRLSRLTLRENDDSLVLVDKVCEEANGKRQSSFENSIAGDSTVQERSLLPKSVGLEDFEVLKVVGQGAFGKVYQVQKIDTSEIFAMKVMRKDKVLDKSQTEYMISERNILTKIDHPFIVQLKYSFQTKYRLYLVLDFVNGGHLFFQLCRQGLFREDLARIYTAEIVSAVSHLHDKGIIHRDLKPENILLDAEGHVVLTDFGLAKQFDENSRFNSLCGTVEYMAPEIILGKGHDKAADWWSVGVLLYEMLTGKPPFFGGNRQKVQQKITKDKIKLPAYLSSDAHSLLKGLLQKEARKRFGSGPKGSDEIKSHKWFRSINWKKLEAREIQPSFCPEVAGKHCVANFEERWTAMPLLESPAASPKGCENPFRGYSFMRPDLHSCK
ncbi:PREDICTED: serine/threonine-protein kinase AtPK2/AtPK19-like [Ipomoea nil]|uniref:serine/threonine-protein kinase AtPK2/AtPK19-like n=1 Tax=Ipomoea nil TaxID=35883 RepID=UPI00090173E0|nr:PREDICTED: serine/threonine-protein kinase AtPK2/AtPK19-like [Ipomoea nil]